MKEQISLRGVWKVVPQQKKILEMIHENALACVWRLDLKYIMSVSLWGNVMMFPTEGT